MKRVSRLLRQDEKTLLAFLLSADFPGCDVLRMQAESATVVGECECGCGTIGLEVGPGLPTAGLVKPHRLEAYGEMIIDVLLFVRNGFLGSLEVVFYEDSAERPYPLPAQLQSGKRPQHGRGDVSSGRES
jgi:hypothetical protein